MAGNLTENFNELCRLCASKINLLVALNIFQGDGEISKKISSCLPIQVHETDRLPKLICSECVYKLDICFDFHEKCIDTENFFIELEKIKNSKDLERRPLELVDNSAQIQIVRNTQDLLEHPNMSITHELGDRENIIVNQQIIINPHENISIHNHELDNIEISPHDLNSHGMTHGNIHSQQLDLHHETTMAQLVQPEMQISDPHLSVQNLDLIHSQHNLINDHYETLHNKNMSTNDNCVDNDINIAIEIKEQQSVAPVKVEEIKENEDNLIMVKTMYSDTSDSDETIEPDFESNIEGTEDKIEQNKTSNIYEESKQFHLSSAEVEINTSKSIQSNVRSNIKNSLDDNFFKEETSDEENNTVRDNSEFINENDDDDNEDGDNNEDSNRNSKRKRWEPKICKECGKSYKTNYKLAEHMRKHTGEQPFKCSTCDKAFRSKIGLAQHEAKHTGQYDYACPTCGKGFQCKSYLVVHQRVHSNLKPFPCSECGRNFKTKQSLLDHMNRHLGVKPYMCEICGRGFITKGLCKSHQKVHSGRDNRQYPCTICNKLFVSKSYLATHLRIHTGEKPFMCEVCGKGFLTRVDLRIHSTMHTGEKSFVCEICGKAFARRDALRCHRRSHTGERPYRCDICGQTFTQFTPMAIHKRLHTGERPYSCEVCKKTFVSRSTMMSHRKKHAP